MGEADNKTAKKVKKPSRWHGIKKEFEKISWPKKDMLLKQSFAVVIITVILSVIIALIDVVIKSGMGLLI
ncbi:MAG: preprotein translocase subunit SecE [Clostridiales bacterium]|nr:preprotein translocase subunit SecE [Clostridiales bacterium]